MKKSECIHIVLQTKQWYEEKTSLLKDLVDKGEKLKILIKDGDGDSLEIPEEHKTGFLIGVSLALEILGKFPVTIEKNI